MKIRHSLETGISFGLTSGIITTLGLIVGLYAGTKSKAVVIGGILTIAFADALSDALGIHLAEEAEAKHTSFEIWEATAATFLGKLIVSLFFVLPVLFLSISLAIWISIGLGFFVLGCFSYYIAKKDGSSSVQAITEHLAVAAVVIFVTYHIGTWVSKTFQ